MTRLTSSAVRRLLCVVSVFFWVTGFRPATSFAQWGIYNSASSFAAKGFALGSGFGKELPIIDFHKSKSIGGIGCLLGACAGAKLSISGDADLDFVVNAFVGGKYDMAFKTNLTSGAIALDPDQRVGSEFVIGTNFNPVGMTKLNYENNLGTAYVGLKGDIGARASAKGCFGGCLSGAIPVDPPPFQLDLLNIKNGSVDILDVNVGSLPLEYTDSNGIISATVNAPKFQKSFKNIAYGASADYQSEQSLANLSVDAANALAAALGLPPLNGKKGPLAYNLLTLEGWAGLNLRNEFQMKPGALSTTYKFSSPVQFFDESANQWKTVNQVTVASGDAARLRAPGKVSLGVFPTYNLAVSGNTSLDLVPAVGYDVSALGVKAFGEGVGPLIHESDSTTLGSINLGDQNLSRTVTAKGIPFNLDFKPVSGQPIDPEQTAFIPINVVVHDDRSISGDYVRITNANDPLCKRDPNRCFVDPSFPAIPITARPNPEPDPTYPIEVADDFSVLAEIVNAADLVPGPITTIDRQLRVLEELGANVTGPPAVIPIGPGHPKLTEPVLHSVVEAFGPLPGDYDGDGRYSPADIDAITRHLLAGGSDEAYDLTENGEVNAEDRFFLIRGLADSVIGDANFDKQFDSSDLIQMFAAGQYEDRVRLNSRWSTGDFNGDFEFDSSDLILAFQAGTYEVPRRAVGAGQLQTVPEPSVWTITCAALLTIVVFRRKT